MKILNIDIETQPAMAYIWDLKTTYVSPDKIIQPKRMLCFAAKWVGEPQEFFYSLWGDGEMEMVGAVWDLMNEADAVLHYNGSRFDIPHIQTEFLRGDLTPPAPFQQIDLYRTVKRRFAFMSNKLDMVSKELETTHKVENGGFSLWTRVMDGDEEAQRTMMEYNIGDIHANESLYEKLLPWIPNHPNRALIDGVLDACSSCGKTGTTVLQGYTHTMVSAYQRYLCTSCGKWTRGSKRLYGADIREAAL